MDAATTIAGNDVMHWIPVDADLGAPLVISGGGTRDRCEGEVGDEAPGQVLAALAARLVSFSSGPPHHEKLGIGIWHQLSSDEIGWGMMARIMRTRYMAGRMAAGWLGMVQLRSIACYLMDPPIHAHWGLLQNCEGPSIAELVLDVKIAQQEEVNDGMGPVKGMVVSARAHRIQTRVTKRKPEKHPEQPVAVAVVNASARDRPTQQHLNLHDQSAADTLKSPELYICERKHLDNEQKRRRTGPWSEGKAAVEGISSPRYAKFDVLRTTMRISFIRTVQRRMVIGKLPLNGKNGADYGKEISRVSMTEARHVRK
ncbi:hypothetical protein F5887DRAFT_922493 [Amanita rubescens]|nr:hypothetical protein F5887DRAFT_922493 [Amanita rubescens]